MKVKGKRTLKNGAVAGYVLQSDGSYKWRIISGPKKTKKILSIPEHCGYFSACHITTVYPNKVEERKCLRFKSEEIKPKLRLSIFSQKLLNNY